MENLRQHSRRSNQGRARPYHSAEYTRYLKSPRWKRLRHDTIAAAQWRCQRCGWQCYYYNGRGLELHHRHYDTLGHERREDLEVLCFTCHDPADRERERATAARLWDARLDGWARTVYGDDWRWSQDHADLRIRDDHHRHLSVGALLLLGHAQGQAESSQDREATLRCTVSACMFELYSDALILEARRRAGRPCLEGSKSRNRLSGDTHAAGFVTTAAVS